MEFAELSKLIFGELKPKLENHQGLSIFAAERAKFEGWLKVELCDSLSKHFKDVIPEQNRIDITFENWAIELKTINTNIRFPNVKNKHRPITRNTQGVVKDIEKLRTTEYTNKSTLFIVFPVRHRNKDWQVQLRRITNKLVKIEHLEFNFKDKIPGTIYFGLTN
ncbi:MAG: hypothetical protein OEX01_00625 [Candidatus Bathyarchaeota archaeon]|nr:hypothetical protein [Candidatus Bathyarchaeota archaeon]